MSNIIQITNDLKGKSTEEIVQITTNNIEEITKNGVAIQNVFAGIDAEIASLEAEQIKARDQAKEREGNYQEAEQVRNKQTALAGLIHQKNALAYQIKKSMSNLDKGEVDVSGAVTKKIEITLDFISGNNPHRFAKLFDKNNPYYYIAIAYIFAQATGTKGDKELALSKLSPFINVLAGANGEKAEFIREAQYICSYFVSQTNPELKDATLRQEKIDELVTGTEALYSLFSTTTPINTVLIGEGNMIESFSLSRENDSFVQQFITDSQTQNYLGRKINSVVLGVDYSDDNKSLGEGDKDSGTEEDNFDDLLDS